MGFNFPSAPTLGQKWPSPPVPGSPVYAWDGEKWMSAGGGSSPLTYIYVSDTPPVGAPDGALWFESDSAKLFALVNDGNSTQWVQILTGVADAVLFLTAQNLTTTQQQQARDNIGLQGILAPWATYTPAVTSDTVTVIGNATGRYKLIGKTLHLCVGINVTVGAVQMYFTLPPGLVGFSTYNLTSRENNVTGYVWLAQPGGANIAICTRYDNSYAVTAGMGFAFSGTFEIT